MNKDKLSIPVTALLERVKLENNPWISYRWQALGVVPSHQKAHEQKTVVIRAQNDGDNEIYHYSGFVLEFEYDELESYYQNLRSNNAKVFIICHQDEDNNDNPKPFLITLSYDEAAIYLETDELVYTVSIDVNIYQKIEEFVLDNYKPEKRKKRKLSTGSAGKNQKGECYE